MKNIKRIFGIILFSLYIIIALTFAVGICIMGYQDIKAEGTCGVIALGISILFMVVMFYGFPKLIKELLYS